MRIELPTIASRQLTVYSGEKLHQETPFLHSSLQSPSARRGIPPFRAAWIMVKKMISSFFAKLLSWFHYQEEKPYFKMKDPTKGEATFYVCKDGRRTYKSLTFGLTRARLTRISFSDQDFPRILQEIIDREQIDQIGVTSVRNAKMVWDCGLKTTTAMMFNPEDHDPFNRRILEMLKCAFGVANPENAILLEIQKEMVESIISDAIAPISNALIIPDQAGEIDIDLAKAKIEKIGKLIGRPIDLEQLLKSVEKDSYLKKTIEKIKEASKANQHATFSIFSYLWAPNAQVVNQPVSLEGISLSFSHIFGLMDITKLSFDGIIIPKIPEIVFTT